MLQIVQFDLSDVARRDCLFSDLAGNVRRVELLASCEHDIRNSEDLGVGIGRSVAFALVKCRVVIWVVVLLRSSLSSLGWVVGLNCSSRSANAESLRRLRDQLLSKR